MSNYISVIFCRNCSSRHVEIAEWSPEGKAVVQCRTCNTKETLSNFTLGRGMISNAELQAARDTMAKKGRYEK